MLQSEWVNVSIGWRWQQQAQSARAYERERNECNVPYGVEKKWQRCTLNERRSSASDVRIRANILQSTGIRKTSISIVYWTCEWNLRFSMMPRKFRIKPENHLASFIRLIVNIWMFIYIDTIAHGHSQTVIWLLGGPASFNRISPDGLFILWCIDSNSQGKGRKSKPHVQCTTHTQHHTKYMYMNVCIQHNQMPELGDIEHTKWYRCYFIEIENYRKSTYIFL